MADVGPCPQGRHAGDDRGRHVEVIGPAKNGET
jgi:hypothetical protein